MEEQIKTLVKEIIELTTIVENMNDKIAELDTRVKYLEERSEYTNGRE